MQLLIYDAIENVYICYGYGDGYNKNAQTHVHEMPSHENHEIPIKQDIIKEKKALIRCVT
jgi:hypothetical protein